jgi:hypothetical protein
MRCRAFWEQRGGGPAARVVEERMKKLRRPPAEIYRLSGLTVNTLRNVTEETGKPNKSTWVALSAVLDLPWDYLLNIVYGMPEKNVAVSPLEKRLADQSAENQRLAARRNRPGRRRPPDR